MNMDRRSFLTLAGLGTLGAGTVMLAACSPFASTGSSGGGGGGGSTGPVRFAWWGGAERQRAYLSGLEAFSAETGIEVEPEFGDYDAFQERMTTQMAARDVPHVFWIPSAAVLTYKDAGIYRSLEDAPGLDLSIFSKEDLDLFRLGGDLDTLPKSLFSPVTRFNQTFLDEAGATMPESPTWEQLAQFLKDYAADNPEGRKGTTYGAYHDMPFELFLRQRGEDLWTEDGRLGASADAVAEWIGWWEDLRLAGATTTISEQDGVSPSWSMVGDKVLATFANSNHIVDEAMSYPDYTFDQRDMPMLDGAADGYHFVYYSRFAMYSGVDDDAVEAAGRLMQFNLTSLDLLREVGLSAGAPPNLALLDEYEPDATPDEQKVIAITREIDGKKKRDRFEAPAGSGDWRNIMVRELEKVTIGDTSVSDAAQNFVDAVSVEIGK
ncbi:ABC-type glycerol-3-phosphate transport system substrate-binding protein [Microbacterium ginsengiterrae]|uniref:ABC-type glycerol-3-phosphate transport system substrate-binding protein n=1 Tax=Microbacterium ginsengiterrae TaxID=546115 RepID=A0A7W9CCC0_9MICO|nr:ABC transporter substrate-binding protein [Microbacterium ginsengiterrae]MBB5742989.1 ABC-type glycerol-3-phosphate transport system substrate-binding protein [Microbacterium ginsengiterrae]